MPYISKGRYYTYGIKSTLVNVRAITGMSAGDTVFCEENLRKLTYDGEVWMCNDFTKVINGTGATVNRGTVLVASTIANTVTLSTTLDNPKVVGVSVFNNVANGAPMAVAHFGIYLVNTNSSTVHGDFAFAASGSIGLATSVNTIGAGCFGIYVENRATNGLTRVFIKPHIDYT